MPKFVISDTSTLILFHKIDEFNLLEKEYGEIITTTEIAEEFGEQFPLQTKITAPVYLQLMKPEKKIIGRRDKADFPELDLSNIDVKIDTGAYTSSIHCEQIEEHGSGDRRRIHFKLLDKSHPEYNNKEFVFSNYRQKRVKNSFGVSEKRFVIETSIVLFGESISAHFTLSERGEMKYPVLLGRKLLNRRFIVDAARTNLSYKQKMKSNP